MQGPPDLSAAKAPHWLEHTTCGRPRFRETSVTGRYLWRDAVTSGSLARWWHTVSARLADRAAVRKSSHIGALLHLHNIFKILKKLRTSMPHATAKEMTLGEYPDPDLEVSLVQQRERFKRSLARVVVLDIPEISWLGAVAAFRQEPAQQWSDANNTNVFMNGSCLRQIPCSSWNRYWQIAQTCQ